jgi:hypothetical protein
MVQIPRDEDSVVADSFVADALVAGAPRGGAAAAARFAVVSARGALLLGIAVANAGLAVGVLLAGRAGADEPPLGDPDERTVGAVALGTGADVAGAGALTVAVGHRAP